MFNFIDPDLKAFTLIKAIPVESLILGLTEINRWDAPKEPLTTLGFTDNLPFQMVTFNTGKSSKTSSILKFISFKEIESESPSKDFIHSSIGLGFITIKVENMDEQLRRLKKANVEFLGETPTIYFC